MAKFFIQFQLQGGDGAWTTYPGEGFIVEEEAIEYAQRSRRQKWAALRVIRHEQKVVWEAE